MNLKGINTLSESIRETNTEELLFEMEMIGNQSKYINRYALVIYFKRLPDIESSWTSIKHIEESKVLGESPFKIFRINSEIP